MKKSIALLSTLLLFSSSLPITSYATALESQEPVTSETTETTEQSSATSESQTDPPKENSTSESTQEPITETATSEETVPVVTDSQPVAEVPYSEPVSEEIVAETPSIPTIHFEKNQTTEDFIQKVGEQAREVAESNDLFASVMIAQAILESGSGSSELSVEPYNNLFGIKGEYQGQFVSFLTMEDDGSGNMYQVESAFRKYPSVKESFEDYSALLKDGLTWNEVFYQGTWKSVATTYQKATEALTGTYATDTTYNTKLNGLIETYNLTQYDFPKTEAGEFTMPLENAEISSPFGDRDFQGETFHRGTDFKADYDTPIKAIQSGIVIIAEYHDSWGNYVAIQHDNGLVSLYAHQSAFAVNVGDNISQGQVIGYVGSTGNSTGSHLHLEICQDSSLLPEKLVDPMSLLQP